MSIETIGFGETPQERGENGEPRVYKIQFEDGYTGDAFEDEIMNSKEDFYRPDHPSKK